ncbi:hypothetical protein H0H81_004722 [Sphagnurus paluster]|uniref:Uncharacterized protein n=1 Tax=Sphagnurus paluster TaxID=117069 RepID=A0A9P7GTP0_9AGAR|nr:hypothetical protein H0H81_004722 [Sphagnurus paluster]
MGGNAFATILRPGSFPRMPPAVYTALKAQLLPKIQSLYECAAVPREAPEKTSHGDLDFIVSTPRINVVDGGEPLVRVNVAHDIVQKAIGAQYVNPLEGNRTSNFAVPVARGEWKALGHGKEEDAAVEAVPDGKIFYQVDINVCASKTEFERVVFFHGYGDLGMIMSMLAKNVGLNLGEKGLRLPNQPHPPIELTESMEEIAQFMGWSMDAWNAGFKTKLEAFEWALTTPFFNPRTFRLQGEGIRKVAEDRTMYAEFTRWVSTKASIINPVYHDEDPKLSEEQKRVAFRERVLVHFNKKEMFDALNLERNQRVKIKEIFNGSRVRDWAELGGYWKGVKLIMDAVREKFGGEAGVLKLYNLEGEEGVKRAVLDAKKQLSLVSKETFQQKPEAISSVDELVTGIGKL